ncbi:MAG: tetratricopeptide repeat protein [Roseomonas sp.]|nr:tetratricopeptide repeat protein [Roseomonas sp.]MCA3331885.1 tetratricopeptide repeat protein [Roseomonas sp.]MCA3336581.1 tetratricopeptide repeat protein [Roseomonas sp.]MCA3356252.1 tetratricopeptide repeat protein [Roseomonas sp.]MCA3373547.1 tetratricopeptide repeat protein [Roseomonas sp.]
MDEAKLYAEAYIDTPNNHDLERSLRFAALLACLHLILEQKSHEEGDAAVERGKPRDTFCPAARKWVHGQLRALGQVQDGAHRESVATYQASLNTALASQPDPRDAARAAEDRKTAEEDIWQELVDALPNEQFPTDFEARFKGEGGHGWFGYFIIFLREALKNQDNARHAFFIGGLSDLQNAVTRIEESQARLEAKVDQLPSAQENVQALMAALGQSGVLARVEAQGLAERFIFSLAARLNPETARNLEQAQREIEAAVDIALDIQRRGLSPGSNEDAFITQVLAEVARRNQEGSLDAGAAAVDAGLAQLAQLENAQREELRRNRMTLLEVGIEQDLLRRDASAVAKRVETLVALETPHRPAWAPAFRKRWNGFDKQGRDKGFDLALEVAIAMSRRMLATAETKDERGTALNLLGGALISLGLRQTDTGLLEQAITVFRSAIEEYTRESAPENWAGTYNNLGKALSWLGEREADTAKLNEAIAAYHAALEVFTRQHSPLYWAMTQNNLGITLRVLGERETGTLRLEQAVMAHQAALKEYTRDRAPLDWAWTQNSLGNALKTLGEREAGTARLEEANTAYRSALQEYTRERVPLDWATAQSNLANVLQELADRDGGTARLEEAITIYRAVLMERTLERVPPDWAATQISLGNALRRLGERVIGTAPFEEAVLAYREALKIFTRAHMPFRWAMTQSNLGTMLSKLGEREAGTARLVEAVIAYRAALEEFMRARAPLHRAFSEHGLGNCLATLAARSPDATPVLAEAITHMQNAVDGYRQVGDEYWGPIAEKRLAELKTQAQLLHHPHPLLTPQ